MRLFLAIELPQETQDSLDAYLAELKKEYPYFSWVPKANFHITLQFLGEVENVDQTILKIERALYESKCFYLYAAEADLFINNRITMYISFSREKELEDIVEKVQLELNMQDEKRFVPHLTFARYRVPSKQQYFLIKKKMSALDVSIEFPVEKIYLFESKLGGKKPIYEKRAEFVLLSK